MPTEIERLYREHRAGLVRLVERELHDHHDAEDVVQTAFLDAQRALERGTVPRNPPAWLATIALNAGRRFRRRRLVAAPLEEHVAHEASGSEIRAALASLPSEQRAAVVYRDVLGYSYGETAEQMGRSVNAVTMLLHRGRQRLRQTLAATTGGPWLWRWTRHAGTPQMAVVKGGAAVIAATGLATAGIVASQAVAPIGTHVPVAVTTGSLGLTTGAGQTPSGTPAQHSAKRHFKATDGSRAGTTPAPATDAVSPSQSASTLQTPSVTSSGAPIPTLPATVAATVSVTTPVTTAAVTTPTGLTVTTPITTITVPLP